MALLSSLDGDLQRLDSKSDGVDSDSEGLGWNRALWLTIAWIGSTRLMTRRRCLGGATGDGTVGRLACYVVIHRDNLRGPCKKLGNRDGALSWGH